MEPSADSPNTLSLRERMAILQELRNEYGELPDIPPENLQAIGYVGLNGPDGVYTVLPEEIAESRKNNAESAINSHKPPFERLTLDVDKNSGFGTTEPVAQLHIRLEQLQTELFYSDDPPRIHILPHTAPANRYAAEGTTQLLVQTSDGPAELFFENYSYVLGLSGLGNKFGFEDDRYVLSGDLGDLVVTYGRVHERTSPLATAEEAEQVWQTLEKIKSYVTDIDELDKHYIHNFGNYELEDVPSATKDAPYIDTQTDALPQKLGRITYNNTSLRLQCMATDLKAYGFVDIARQFATCITVQEARMIITAAINNNGLKAQAKATENNMRKARATLHHTDENAIRAFATELSDHRAKAKAEQQRLRGIHDVLFLPQIYAIAAKQKIEQIQKSLVVAKDASRTTLTLDARPDTELDADPGEKSGDCTEGMPLPFGVVPVHNVKVFDGDRHVGNMYLLETEDMRDNRAWHLDAIQVPIISYDWDIVATKLIATLSEQAKAKDVKMITINDKPHLVSNYDYIGDAFMKKIDPGYTPAARDSIGYDLAKQASVPTTNVVFPEKVAEYSRFQGDDTDQIILWQDN